MQKPFKFLLAAGLVAGIAISSPSWSHSDGPAVGDADNAIKYREGVMHTIGANAGAIAAIMKGDLPHKDTLAEHARVLAIAAGWANDAFHQNTHGMGKEKTTATEDVWKDWDKFAGIMDDMEEEAQKIAVAAEAGDMDAVGAGLKPLFKTCKSCHDDFRKK